jgi:hypothetical protein
VGAKPLSSPQFRFTHLECQQRLALAIDMETLDVIAKGTSQSIKEIIKEQLQKQRDLKKRLSIALHYLSTAVELEEQVGEIAAESWSYI